MSFANPTTLEKLSFRLEWALSGPLIRLYLRRLRLRGDETLLEVGCGGGAVTRQLARLLPQGAIVGVDPSSYWTAYARRRLRAVGNVRLVTGDLLSSRFREASFDAALFHYVLHEIPPADRSATLTQLHALLRDEGLLFLREPTAAHHGIPSSSIQCLLAETGFEAGLVCERWLPLFGRHVEIVARAL